MAYDVAAGGLIAAEAGAVVSNVYGNPDYLSPPNSILAANPAIHAQLLAVICETYPEIVGAEGSAIAGPDHPSSPVRSGPG